MATLEAHMTELKAVNQMLRSISEQPVSQLGSGQIDSDNAEEVLEESKMTVAGGFFIACATFVVDVIWRMAAR